MAMAADSADFFFRLTPDKVLDLIEYAGLVPSGHCQALNSLENRVFEIVLENRSHVVAKFYRPGRWSREQIQDEHDLLFELQEQEIPVCAPQRFPDGTSIAEIENIFCAVWPKTGGREPLEMSDEDLGILGRLLGRIHLVGAARKAEHRPEFSGRAIGETALQVIRSRNMVPEPYREQYETYSSEIIQLCTDRVDPLPRLRIHGDCHLGNLLFNEQGWTFLDFDDCMNGPAIQDFWMILGEGGDRRRAQIMIDGYRQFMPFEDNWLELTEILRGLRFVHYAGWIAKRWEDPAFAPAFPHFGSDEYWRGETEDLRLQLEKIHGRSIRSGEAEEELSNKDFFWDWQD